MKPLTVQELINELQELVKRGHADKPVYVEPEGHENDGFCGVTAIDYFNDTMVVLSIRP